MNTWLIYVRLENGKTHARYINAPADVGVMELYAISSDIMQDMKWEEIRLRVVAGDN